MPNIGPTELIIILAVLLLLFGGSKLPQLAKALGQSKRAFREGIDEGEKESAKQLPANSATNLSDEELFEEARRRAAATKQNQ
jgi:sec-independent protein translocase protein TatA